MNFSVPDDMKRDFNEAFAGENKSAVLTRLMRQAIAERHRERIRTAAIEAVFELRKAQPAVADREIARER